MKRLSLTTLFIFLSIWGFSQKTVDLEVYLIPLKSEVGYGEQLLFDIGIVNHGPDDLDESDTVVFFLPHMVKTTETDAMIGLFTDIPAGDTFKDDSQPYFAYNNNLESDSMMIFCIEVMDLNGVTNRGRPVAVTYEDPNPENDTFCAPAVLIKGKDKESSLLESNLNQFSIYPNPVHDRIWVRSPVGNPLEARVTLLSLDGRIIDQLKLSSLIHDGLDISTYPSGIYILKIGDKQVIYTEKLVKM